MKNLHPPRQIFVAEHRIPLCRVRAAVENLTAATARLQANGGKPWLPLRQAAAAVAPLLEVELPPVAVARRVTQ